MSRCVDHVETIIKAVARAIGESDALRLDGNSALPFERHRVQHLFLHFPRRESAALLDEPIGQSRLTVVDVRNDGEISNAFLLPTAHE